MIKVLSIIYLLTMFCLAQHSNNGNIRFVYNGEKIDLPINKISLSKVDAIVLCFNAEKQDSIVQQFVTFNIGLKKLSPEPDAESFNGTKINIKTKNNKTDSGKELSMWFYDNFVDNNNQSEISHYAIYNKGERVSWEINSVSFKIDITKLEYTNSSLHIFGEFEGTLKSTEAPQGQIAKIEDGKFEVIL